MDVDRTSAKFPTWLKDRCGPPKGLSNQSLGLFARGSGADVHHRNPNFSSSNL